MAEILEFPTHVTAPEIMEATGITYRMLDYWTRTGLLVPRNNEPGHGHHRQYPPSELAKAKAVSALLRAGLSLPAIREHITEITTVGALTYGPVTITYTPEEDPA